MLLILAMPNDRRSGACGSWTRRRAAAANPRLPPAAGRLPGPQGDAPAAERDRRARAEAVPLVSAARPLPARQGAVQARRLGRGAPHFDAALTGPARPLLGSLPLGHLQHAARRPIQAKDRAQCLPPAEPGLPWLYELRGFASYQIATLARTAAESMQAKGNTLRTESQLQLQAAEADYSKPSSCWTQLPRSLRYVLLVNRGLLWLERREWDKAVADLQAAIKLDGRQWPAFENLAQVYVRQNKPDQAIEQFTRAIELRPGWAPLYRARAAVNQGRQRPRPGPAGSSPRRPGAGDPARTPGEPGPGPGPDQPRARLLHQEAPRGGAGRLRGGAEDRPRSSRCPPAPHRGAAKAEAL